MGAKRDLWSAMSAHPQRSQTRHDAVSAPPTRIGQTNADAHCDVPPSYRSFVCAAEDRIATVLPDATNRGSHRRRLLSLTPESDPNAGSVDPIDRIGHRLGAEFLLSDEWLDRAAPTFTTNGCTHRFGAAAPLWRRWVVAIRRRLDSRAHGRLDSSSEHDHSPGSHPRTLGMRHQRPCRAPTGADSFLHCHQRRHSAPGLRAGCNRSIREDGLSLVG